MNSSLATNYTINSFNSNEFEALSSNIEKIDSVKPLKQNDPNFEIKNSGHWNYLQKELYYIFLITHKENFVKKELRRTDKIFKEMSKFIKTRAADQCRSHHQKLQKKYCSFNEILNSLKQNCSGKNYEQLLRTFENEETKAPSASIPISSEIENSIINFDELIDQKEVESSCSHVDELELAISSPGLFYEEALNIDNYFLI